MAVAAKRWPKASLDDGRGLLGGLGDADDHSRSHSMIIQRLPGVESHNLPASHNLPGGRRNRVRIPSRSG